MKGEKVIVYDGDKKREFTDGFVLVAIEEEGEGSAVIYSVAKFKRVSQGAFIVLIKALIGMLSDLTK